MIAGLTRAVLVANPASHGGRCADEIPIVTDYLRAMDIDFTVRVTSCLQDGYDFAAAAGPDEAVLSLGGDGIHAYVAGGAAAAGAVMCPLPGGRGNDFVRSLGGHSEPWQQLALLNDGRVKRIDLGEITALGAEDTSPRTFVGVTCVGFDSLANAYANEPLPFLRGRAAYTFGGVRALLESRPQEFAITVDGVRHEFLARSVAVGQSGCYGGGMRTCPTAVQDDGMLDVTVVGEVSGARFPLVLLDQFRGKHLRHAGVHALRGQEILLETTGKVRMAFADGDPVGELPLRLTAKKQVLQVVVP